MQTSPSTITTLRSPGRVARPQKGCSVEEKARILILEDDPELLSSLTEILGDHGYEVTPVGSGKEAVDAVARQSYDLIVADIRMEGMSGLDAVEASRQHQPEIGTLIISGYATPENTARAMQLQAGKILSKPFKLKEFVARVQEQLALRQKSQARDKRERGHERSLIWSLQVVTRLLNLVSEDASTSLSQELAQRLGHRLGLSRQVSLEVGLAAGLLSAEEHLGGVPEWFLQDTTALPTLKYCLEHHDDPMEVDPPRVEARIVALTLAVFDQNWHAGQPYPPAAELADRGLDPTVLEAYHHCLNTSPAESETGESHSDCRQLLSLAHTLRGLGEVEGARRAYAQVVATASGRDLVGGLLGLARLELRAKEKAGMSEACRRAVEEAARLGPVTYATTLLESGLMSFQAGDDASELLRRAVVELERLGFDGSVALAAVALMDLGHQPNPAQISKYLEALSQPRYADEVAACSSWLVPSALKLLSQMGTEENRKLVLRLLCLLPSELGHYLGSKDVTNEIKSGFLEQLAALGGGLIPTGALEILALDPDGKVSRRALELQRTLVSGETQTLLRCKSFGIFEVSCGPEQVRDKDWKTKKVRYYFAYLAAQWGTFMSDDMIIEEFWPGKSRDRGKQNLYWATSMARNCLNRDGFNSKELVERREETMRLNPEVPHWHDVQEFEGLFEAGKSSLSRAEYGQARNQFSRMAELYTGPYLEGYYKDWAVRNRERLQLKALEGLCALAECCLKLEEPRGALEAARRAVALDPASEPAHLLAMQAQLGLSQPHAAVEQFQQCVKTLKDEYDLEPTIEAYRLYEIARGRI